MILVRCESQAHSSSKLVLKSTARLALTDEGETDMVALLTQGLKRGARWGLQHGDDCAGVHGQSSRAVRHACSCQLQRCNPDDRHCLLACWLSGSSSCEGLRRLTRLQSARSSSLAVALLVGWQLPPCPPTPPDSVQQAGHRICVTWSACSRGFAGSVRSPGLSSPASIVWRRSIGALAREQA